MDHYCMSLNIRNVTSAKVDVDISAEMLCSKETAAAVGQVLGTIAKTAIIKEEG